MRWMTPQPEHLLATAEEVSASTQLGQGSYVPAGSASVEGGAPPNVDAALDDVRAMAEFKPEEPSWWDEFWEQSEIRDFFKRVEKAIDDFFNGLNDAVTAAVPDQMSGLSDFIVNVITYVLSVVAILLVVSILYLVLSYLRERFKKPPQDDDQTQKTTLTTLLVTAGHHRAQSQQLAAQGEYDAALRHLYLAALCLLRENEIAGYAVAKTNWEYLSELTQTQSAKDLKPLFEELTRAFENTFYGEQPVDQTSMTDMDTVLNQFETRIVQQAPTVDPDQNPNHDKAVAR